jgi:uncharacterized protein YjbI with pentapeptide repeats
MTKKCSYNHGNGETCKHPAEEKALNEAELCLFHQTIRPGNAQKRFWWRLKRLDLKGDGDWRGFNFPITKELENVVCKTSLRLQNARLYGVKIKQGVFEGNVDMTGCKISSLELQTCKFKGSVDLSGLEFSFFKAASIEVEESFIAKEVKFDGEFFISGALKQSANFNRCHFSSKATFIQTKTVSLAASSAVSFTVAGPSVVITQKPGPEADTWTKIKYQYRNYKSFLKSRIRHYVRTFVGFVKKLLRKIKTSLLRAFNRYRVRFPHRREHVVLYVLFNSRAMLEEINFAEPKKVTFNGIRLSEASFRNTDLRGVNFIGNDWRQKKIKRNGLFDELSFHQQNDYYSRREMLPGIENTYRNIRYSLEENKDFGLANDFFVGEMEAKRRQLKWWRRWLLSVPAAYKIFSNYGTSPLRVFLWLSLLTFLNAYHLWDYSIYANESLIEMNTSEVDISSSLNGFETLMNSIKINVEGIRGVLTYSIQTLTLQKDKLEIFDNLPKNSSVYLINTLYAVIGPIIIALFAVSIRTRIKRN